MKLLPTRAWRLDEKPLPLASLLHQPDSSKSSHTTVRSSARKHRDLARSEAERTSSLLRQLFGTARLARRRNSKGQPTLAEELPRARRQRRARAAHIARDHRASETTHKKRPPTRVTQTSPTAFNRLTRQNRAGPRPHDAGHHVQAETVATAPTPRAGVLRYSLRSSAKTRTTVIRAAGSV